MTPLGLRALPQAAVGLQAAVGSLPSGFRLAAEPTRPHVVWVTSHPGWPETVAAALADGALAVALEARGPVSPAEIERFAGAPVILVGTRTHAPQLRDLARALPRIGQPAFADLLVVEGGPTAPDPAAALWDAVAMLTAAGLALTSVPQVMVGNGAVLADAEVNSARVHLACVHRTGAIPRAVLKVFGSSGSAQATMGDPDVGLPGEVLVVGTDDARLAGTRYVTPCREALAELHEAASGGAASASGRLELHARASQLLSQVAWPPQEHPTPTQPEGRSR